MKPVRNYPPNCSYDGASSHETEDIPVGVGYRRNDYGELLYESFAINTWIRACKNCSYCEAVMKPLGKGRTEYNGTERTRRRRRQRTEADSD